MSERGTWALVPLKRMDRGKERLGDALDATLRRELIAAMAADVLDALRGAGIDPARILLVSEDAGVATLAARCGVGLYRPAPAGSDPLNAALREATTHVLAAGARELLILHADLPLASAPEIRELLAAHRAALAAGGPPLVTLVSDRQGQGTNGLLATPPAVIGLHFGAGSRHAHHSACVEAGVRFAEFSAAGLCADIDHPPDLEALVRICQSPDNACGARTRALLAGAAIAARSGRNS